ncbi:hypothetical protein A0H81_05762 [Grifola frondosa]|uniref:Uncharacterized protein n=1 Tax=Grifola frondosa TaxID=5627 RepID=A0A1C7MBP9_GRIFR|nr:hypothetical protein A0H81_05762 [Grifola frondosa]
MKVLFSVVISASRLLLRYLLPQTFETDLDSLMRSAASRLELLEHEWDPFRTKLYIKWYSSNTLILIRLIR